MDREIQNWWATVPFITRWLFASMGLLTLTAGLGLINNYYLMIVWELTIKKFQIWRPITATLHLGALNFGFLILLLFLYRYSTSLEVGSYAGRTGDYLYAILICSVFNLVFAFFMGFRITGAMLVMSIIYIWSRHNADQEVSFYFGVKFKGIYLPWAMMALNFIAGGGHFPWDELLGCLSAHIYYYVNDIYPRVHGTSSYFKTPSFIHRILPVEIQDQQRVTRPNEQQRNAPGARNQGGYNWGTGRALG